MIDFHNHIIPNIDDGAKSIEMSIDMLREAEKQGITDVISTIHFQHPKMDGKNTDYSFVKEKYLELKEIIIKNHININIHLSAEVFYLPNLTKISDNPLVTVGNGKFMLIEFQTKVLPPNYLMEFFKLQQQGITPIIAHPERYVSIQENSDLGIDWLSRGFVMQLDCGSILGHFGKKCENSAKELLRSGCIQLIGSDAHNNKIRNFCLEPAYDKIESLFGSRMIKTLKYNSSLLLEGKSLQIIESENIDIVETGNNVFNRLNKIINLFKGER
tara:strand:- start:239 stop:1054 length:816 start_codon:yes stop_codon:yes gene_type:complete